MQYFVHYTYVSNEGVGGSGNANIEISVIENIEDIRGIESELNEKNKFNSVTVTNFVLFE